MPDPSACHCFLLKAEEVLAATDHLGRPGFAITADNKNAQAVTGAVAQTVAHFGRMDVLVNNAGIYLNKPLDAYLTEDFDQLIAVNVRAVFLATQAAARYLPAGGRIINIGSNMADRVPTPNGSLYAMSKSALRGLTKGVARELGSRLGLA